MYYLCTSKSLDLKSQPQFTNATMIIHFHIHSVCYKLAATKEKKSHYVNKLKSCMYIFVLV